MIRCEKVFESPILAEKSDSILVKTFFFFRRSPVFERKKRLNFRAFREIPSQFSDKPCETDSRAMKIRVEVVCTFLTLSKKPPPPLFQILATRLKRPTNFRNVKIRVVLSYLKTNSLQYSPAYFQNNSCRFQVTFS